MKTNIRNKTANIDGKILPVGLCNQV